MLVPTHASRSNQFWKRFLSEDPSISDVDDENIVAGRKLQGHELIIARDLTVVGNADPSPEHVACERVNGIQPPASLIQKDFRASEADRTIRWRVHHAAIDEGVGVDSVREIRRPQDRRRRVVRGHVEHHEPRSDHDRQKVTRKPNLSSARDHASASERVCGEVEILTVERDLQHSRPI